jgi:hypothetical protein
VLPGVGAGHRDRLFEPEVDRPKRGAAFGRVAGEQQTESPPSVDLTELAEQPRGDRTPVGARARLVQRDLPQVGDNHFGPLGIPPVRLVIPEGFPEFSARLLPPFALALAHLVHDASHFGLIGDHLNLDGIWTRPIVRIRGGCRGLLGSRSTGDRTKNEKDCQEDSGYVGLSRATVGES